jgi:hypothetical protein
MYIMCHIRNENRIVEHGVNQWKAEGNKVRPDFTTSHMACHWRAKSYLAKQNDI